MQLVIEAAALVRRPGIFRSPGALRALMQGERIKIVRKCLRQRRPVEPELELVFMQIGDGLVGEDQAFAVAEIEPDIGAFLGGMAENLIEGGQAILVEPDLVVIAEIGDEVAAIALGDDEGIGPAAARQHVVSGAAVDGLAAAAANYDVVGIIAIGMTVVARDCEIFEVFGQGVIHPGDDGIRAGIGRLIGMIEAGIEIIDVVAGAAHHRHVDGSVAPHGVVAIRAVEHGSGAGGGKETRRRVAIVKWLSKGIQN